MKRRKGWFIALSHALLATCGSASSLPKVPPYRFMKGATLWFTEPSVPARGVHFRGGTFETTFVSKRPMSDVLRDAQIELPGDWYLSNDLGGFRPPDLAVLRTFGTVVVICDVRMMFDWHGWQSKRYPALPEGYGCFVVVIRTPSIEDIVRGAIYSVRWKGSGK
jgi:hypothetical protein